MTLDESSNLELPFFHLPDPHQVRHIAIQSRLIVCLLLIVF